MIFLCICAAENTALEPTGVDLNILIDHHQLTTTTYLLLILGWEGLQRGDPESLPPVRWRRDGQDLIQESEESSQGAGREPYRWRAAGKTRKTPCNIVSCLSPFIKFRYMNVSVFTSLHSSFNSLLVSCVCEGDDRRGRQGRRWRGEPAGVPAHYEENLPVLKEVH